MSTFNSIEQERDLKVRKMVDEARACLGTIREEGITTEETVNTVSGSVAEARMDKLSPKISR